MQVERDRLGAQQVVQARQWSEDEQIPCGGTGCREDGVLRQIRIEGYKSLVNVEVALKPLCLLFGPNAAGKSNFLDALQLLSRTATSRTLKEAFEPPYRCTPLESFTFGPRDIPGLLEQESASL